MSDKPLSPLKTHIDARTVGLSIKTRIESFQVCADLHAVNVESSISEKDAVKFTHILTASPSVRFGFVTDNRLGYVMDGHPLTVEETHIGRVLGQHVSSKSETDWPGLSESLDASNWKLVITGKARALYAFKELGAGMWFDATAERPLHGKSSCRLICERLKALSSDQREDALCAVLEVPGIYTHSFKPGVSARVQASSLLRNSDRDGLWLGWQPEADVWHAVTARVMETNGMPSSMESHVKGPDGRAYPRDFQRALELALLDMHPEVAALLEPARAPSP